MKKILLAIFALFCGTIINGCDSEEQSDSQDILVTAYNHYQNGNYAEAVRYYRLAAEQGHSGAQEALQ